MMNRGCSTANAFNKKRVVKMLHHLHTEDLTFSLGRSASSNEIDVFKCSGGKGVCQKSKSRDLRNVVVTICPEWISLPLTVSKKFGLR
jgi:hypothetical protein